MAQLSPDSFATGERLLRLDEALDNLAGRLAGPAASEPVPVMQALGRVLAEPVVAPFAIPDFDNSAVDGYALRFADLAATGETRLPVALRIPAGRIGVPDLAAGQAARIFTGAMMPGGADTVFMQEDVRREGESVILPPGLKAGANRRFAGEDFAKGAMVASVGTRLRPQHLAGLAAAGRQRIAVRPRLRVAIFSTGNEIREPAMAPPPPGCQYDANRAMLAGLLAARGMAATDLGILPDDAPRMARALAEAAEAHDAILTSGGVSTGEEDHVKAAIEAAGRLDFWRLAIKPGRPIAMGHLGGTPFLGMPGNPAAVFVTFLLFVGPVLDMLAGAQAVRPAPIRVPSGFDYRKKADRREYIRVSLAPDAAGRLVAQRFPKDGAALISSLIAADALAELDEATIAIEAGEAIPVLPLAMLMA